MKPIHSCCKWGTQSFPFNSKGQNNWFFYSYILHAHVLCKHIQTKHSTKHTLVAPFLLDKIYHFFHEIMGTCAFLCTFNFYLFYYYYFLGRKIYQKFYITKLKRNPTLVLTTKKVSGCTHKKNNVCMYVCIYMYILTRL